MEELLLSHQKTASPAEDLVFKHLPAYAKFVREKFLLAYVEEHLRVQRKNSFSFLHFLNDLFDEEDIEAAVGAHSEFLLHAERNILCKHLEVSLEHLKSKDLTAKKNAVSVDDIYSFTDAHKKALLKFLPQYSTDVTTVLAIVSEIDVYCRAAHNATVDIFLGQVNERFAALEKKERKISSRLKHREEAYFNMQKVYDLSNTGRWAMDLRTNKIEWSETLYKIYEIPNGAELHFDDIVAYNEPAHNQKLQSYLKNIIQTLQPFEFYYRITLSSGVKKILYAKTEAVVGDENKAIKLTGIVQDVTQQQRLILDLQNNEALYKESQALSHVGNWAMNMETNVVHWSDELYRIYGLEPQSSNAIPAIEKYLHPEDKVNTSKLLKQLLRKKKPFDLVYRIILDDGTVKTLQLKGKIVANGNKIVKIYGTVQDITEQKVFERQLNEYKEFIEKISNVSPSLIASYNVHTGKYSYINNSLQSLLGYAPSIMMENGLSFYRSIIHPEDLPAILKKQTQSIENSLSGDSAEPITVFKYRIKNVNGFYRWLRTYTIAFERDEKGKVESMLDVSIDITDQENAESELYKKNMELQQSNKSLEEYAYVTSHDLKEPLRKIATFSDRLLTSQNELLTDEGKLYLNKIVTSAKRMQSMINDLLKVSTIMGNKAYEQCNLNALLEEATQHLDHKIEECNAIVESDILPKVSVVPSQFRQMFQNLINNSLKFARRGVRPHIKISHRFLGPKDVEFMIITKARKYLQIDIEDNGIGFDNEYSTKIFSIFQRLHGKTEYDGTGIGLGVCKKIMENHAGVIFANGEVNKGATFTIILPVYQRPLVS